MAIPTIFTQQVPSALASYDWVDVASGQGYIRFYAFNDGTNFKLGDSKIYTDNADFASYNNTSGTTTFTTSIFNSARILNGTIYFEISNYKTSSVARTFTMSAVLKKISGGVTTTIATSNNYSASINTSGVQTIYMNVLNATIANEGIAAGDYLQLELTAAVAGTATFRLRDDPFTTDGAELGPTALVLPFKIDL